MNPSAISFEDFSQDWGSAPWLIDMHVDAYGMINMNIDATQLIQAVEDLRAYEKAPIQFLTDLCAVHYPERSGKELEVVYHLHCLTQNLRLRVKAALPESQARIPSLCSVFAGANWMERETFDFYGIQFEGHPDLRRILNMDEMDYHPLLKQYALEDETRDDKDDRFFGR